MGKKKTDAARSASPVAPSGYAPATDAELKQLAADVYEGRVITSRRVPSDLWLCVFLPLLGIDPKSPWLRDAQFIYGHERDRVGDRAIDGFPSYGTIGAVHTPDLQRFAAYFDEYAKFQKSFRKEEPS